MFVFTLLNICVILSQLSICLATFPSNILSSHVTISLFSFVSIPSQILPGYIWTVWGILLVTTEGVCSCLSVDRGHPPEVFVLPLDILLLFFSPIP